MKSTSRIKAFVFCFFSAICLAYGPISSKIAIASVIAEEKSALEVIARTGNSLIEISYIVSIEDSTPPEKLEDVIISAIQGGGHTVERIDDYNFRVTINVQVIDPGIATIGWVTTATERFKNKLRKKEFQVKVDGIVSSPSGIPGFEFKTESDGVFLLFNDSTENWTVDQLLIRINRDYLDLETFNLDSPTSLDWDFDIDPFALLSGDVFELPLGEKLLQNSNIYSQFFAVVTETSTGVSVKDAGQHQHISEPSTSFLIALGALLVLLGNKQSRSAADAALDDQAIPATKLEGIAKK
ncbi:MAG: hypothetical protein PVG66_06175 [Chromatiales bacterium]|jgi:hypothetical protein